MTEDTSMPPSIETLQALAVDGPFEETLSALEAVADHLERGRLSIEESVTWYEIGLKLSRRCADLLQQAELRIRSVEDRYAVASRRDIDWDKEEPRTDAVFGASAFIREPIQREVRPDAQTSPGRQAAGLAPA